MRQRPIGALVELLKNLGVRSEYAAMPGFPPLRIHPRGLAGGIARYGAEQSSQFLSAVIMAAPYARHEVQIDLHGKQTSWPYVAMTMQLMNEFGVTPELIRIDGEPRTLIIPREPYQPIDYAIEPDASNATYFIAAAAVHSGASVTIQRLGTRSLQGDVGFANVLKRMGADVTITPDSITVRGTDELFGIDADLAEMPDTAQTLAVVALFADGETNITGLHTLRVKETDRLAAVATELRKLGATVESTNDSLRIVPPKHLQPASIATYDDHRMAMSFSIAASKAAGVTILNPDCVNKTYPDSTSTWNGCSVPQHKAAAIGGGKTATTGRGFIEPKASCPRVHVRTHPRHRLERIPPRTKQARDRQDLSQRHA